MRKDTQPSTHSPHTVPRTGTVAHPSFPYEFAFSQWLVEMLIILEVTLVQGTLLSRVVLLHDFHDFSFRVL